MTEIPDNRSRRPELPCRREPPGALVWRAAATACGLALCATTVFAQVESTYLYTLSNFSGPLRYEGVRVRVDRERDETYLIYQNLVRVFNPSGMEIFSFGDDLDLGQILDVAIDSGGDVILLSYKNSRSVVTRCNFRGVPIGTIEVKGLPEGLAFDANRMVLQNGVFYFVSLMKSSVIIVGLDGGFRKHIELLSLLEADDLAKGEMETIGFDVGPEGDIYFTVPVLFKVFKLAPDGTVSSFGRPGSAAGRFGVLGGVAIDSHGNVIVADKLKCVVMVFDRNFKFIREFGYRGSRPGNLIQPDDLAIDRKDRLYVSQARRRGVSVFALTSVER